MQASNSDFYAWIASRSTITWTNLAASFDTTDLSSYTTASISPTANKLLLMSVVQYQSSGTAATPTVTGAGLTWTVVTTAVRLNRRCTVFRATGASPSTGALTIDFAGNTQSNCGWSVNEATNAVITGTNASDAVVQTKILESAGPGTPVVTTFDAALEHSTNHMYISVCHASNNTITADATFTQLSQANMGAVGAVSQCTQYAANKTSNSTAITDGNTCIVAVEVKSAG